MDTELSGIRFKYCTSKPFTTWNQTLDIPFEMPVIIRGKHGGTRQLIRGRLSYSYID
jgi:hypothetical protein